MCYKYSITTLDLIPLFLCAILMIHHYLAGTYAFRLPDDSGEGGVWVSYEDPDTAGQRATYAK